MLLQATNPLQVRVHVQLSLWEVPFSSAFACRARLDHESEVVLQPKICDFLVAADAHAKTRLF